MTDTPPPRSASQGQATLLVTLAACSFGAIAILVTLATGTGAPLMTLLVGRFLLGGLLLAVMARMAGELRLDRDAWRVVLYGGIGQVLVSIVTLSALRFIPAATLSFLFYTYPAWVAVITKFRHSEPLTPVRLFALALSLAGIFVMVGAPGAAELHPAGVALALGGALIYAVYVPLIAHLERRLAPRATATWMSLGAALFLVPIGAMMGDLTVELHRTAWVAILILAVVSTALAFTALLKGLRVLGPVRTAIVATVEPFFTALAGAWLLRQPLTRNTLIGGALIAAAVILLQLHSPNRREG